MCDGNIPLISMKNTSHLINNLFIYFRFPSVVKILTVNEVIEAILKSIKTEAREVSVPRHFYYFDQFMR